MGDLQLYGMTNLALGEYRTFRQRSLNLLSISTAKELGIEMRPELVAGAYAVTEMPLLNKRIRAQFRLTLSRLVVVQFNQFVR